MANQALHLLGREIEDDNSHPDALPQQFRELVESLPVAAYICNAEGLITYYNQQAVALWGRAPELNNPKDRWCGSFKLYSPVDGSLIPHHACWMALAIQTGEPQIAQEIIVEQPNGQRITELAHANPIRDSSGRIVGAMNVLVDISDRTRADHAMARLGAIVQSSDDAIISKTLEGRIVSWNAAAERIFGYTAEEAVGQSISLILPPEREGEEAEILAKLRRGERVEHYETVRLAKDGRRLDISLTTSPVQDASGRVIGASKVARDISERKRNEEALRRLNDELRQADRSRNDFLATLAHELRNPLAPIRNTVESLHLTNGLSQELRSALGVIERQLHQMTRLIDDLMDVSRITNNKLLLRKERIDLADVLHAAVESSRPLLTARGHDFGVDLPPEPLVLDADLTRLAQVLANLLNNAAKYTERGGRIRLAAKRQGNEAVITVRDNGVGIPPEAVAQIFDMFSQVENSLDRSQGGLGIGLTLARRLIEMHGGSVSVWSDGTGKGSEFTVRLPVAAGRQVPRTTTGTDRSRPLPATPLRILVVDDNRDSADSLGMLLQVPGNEVRIAYDGLHALDVAEEFRPDLVLLDIGLPKLDGYATAQRIREQPWGKSMALIALTGWGQEEAKQRSKEAGLDAHLVKPVDPDVLMRELARLTRTPR